MIRFFMHAPWCAAPEHLGAERQCLVQLLSGTLDAIQAGLGQFLCFFGMCVIIEHRMREFTNCAPRPIVLAPSW